ncbi:MAG: hypothetical protein NVSMB2_20010 [Chloroflexota bacterium]
MVVLVMVGAACAAPAASVPASGASSTPAIAAQSPAAVAPSSSPAAAASPSAPPAERVDGTIQRFSGPQLTLASGRAFVVPSTVRVSRSTNIAAADLKTGDYVAITGNRQSDNIVLATIVNVFPPSLGQVAPGQRPLPEGNLMTNATIDQIQGTSFVVTFPGGGARIQLAPDARITRAIDATPAELVPGASISAQIVDNTARAITIQPAS